MFMSSDKNRNNTRIAVYLIGLKNNQILLGKRINASYMNNHWSLPAGHVFEGESVSQAMIRESQEECGVTLTKQDLQMIGAFHFISGPHDYANYVFKVDLTDKIIVNAEPDKCEALQFFDIDHLPNPIPDYVRIIIDKSVHAGCPWIDEFGF